MLNILAYRNRGLRFYSASLSGRIFYIDFFKKRYYNKKATQLNINVFNVQGDYGKDAPSLYLYVKY